jgi:hypothetical protein
VRTTRASVLALLLGGVVVACSGSSSASGSPTARPTLSPGGSASVEPFRTPTPTPKPSVGGSDSEAMLRELLPGGGTGATCAAATDTGDRVAEARIRCTYKSLGQTLWLSQYQDGDELGAAYLEQQAGAKTAGKGCEAARFHGTYSLGGTQQGQVACLKKSADAWIVWTIEDRFVLGEATRKGNKSKPLYQWWAKVKPVGAKGALKLTTTTPPPAESLEPSPTEE